MQKHASRLTMLTCLLASAVGMAAPSVTRTDVTPGGLQPLSVKVQGRVLNGKYQWPGTYAEVAFKGSEIYFSVGPEPVILNVWLDGVAIAKLVKPEAGTYQILDITSGPHVLRVESASENQAAPLTSGSFAAPPTTKQAPLPARSRQIEFIGDSHTVGYGNTSGKRGCTEDEVWSTTDTSKAFAPLVAKHYDADYQVNAISGRGIVRNYGGFNADPLPVAYPYALFDKATRYQDAKWNPQVIVISLGTNDFTTPLHDGESWKTRDELHADYESTYRKFLQSLRQRNPHALIALWATDMADGEIAAEVKKVVDQFVASGDKRTVFLPVNGLTLSACNWHPSTQDDRTIADAIVGIIDQRVSSWRKP